jgi:putative tricarboxylic transport membrane protein
MNIGVWVVVLGMLALPAAEATAQSFKPTQPVELVVHTGPGGGSDVFARIVNTIFEQEKLLPVRANIANRSGGGGTVAMSYVAERKGDPHVIAFYTSVWLTAPLTTKEARVQFTELTPIANLVYDPSLIIVRADSPYKTLNDFVEAAKKNPGKLLQAGSSIQAIGNLIRQVIQKQSGATWTYVPMPGGSERNTAILGGHAQILIADPAEVHDQLQARTMRVIAQMAERRLPAHPDVPTLQEAGYRMPNIRTVRGVVAPPGLTKDAVAYWESVFDRLVKSDGWRKYLSESQTEDGYVTGDQLLRLTEESLAARREVFKEVGIKMVR